MKRARAVIDKMKHHSFFTQGVPWSNNNNNIWLASTLCLLRNLEKYKFPAKLSVDQRKQIIALVDKGMGGKKSTANTLIAAEMLQPIEKEYLFEHFLTTQSFQQVHTGEAFIVDNTGEFLAILNVRDHIQLQVTDCHEDLENSWNKLAKIEIKLGNAINFSFSPKFGFLTADAAHCGTGLVVSVFLHLPALIHSEKVQEALKNHSDSAISFVGLHGSPTEMIGDLLVLRNNYTLGITEENIISTLRTLTTKLILHEREARQDLLENDHANIKDKVSRAYGLLIHSYQIETVEALNAISLLKLGLDVQWLSGITMGELNALFFQCRRAHLLYGTEEKITQEELPHKRAVFVHKALQNTHLNI